MVGRIALFELRYQLRRPIALISFIVLPRWRSACRA